MSATALADLVIRIRTDGVAQAGTAMQQLGTSVGSITAPAQSAAASLTMTDRAATKFLQDLKDQAATVGMTKTQIAAYRAEQLGVTAQAAGFIEQIEKAGHGMEGLGLNTQVARRELVVMGHEALQGNWKNLVGSFTVLAEHSNIGAAALSGLGVAAAAGAAALATVAAAAIAGARESDALTKSLTLTGNAAGVTEAGFAVMARTIADGTGKSMGTAREALQELVSTGQFTGAALTLAGEDIVQFSTLSGESLDKVAADYAKMPEGVTKWAVEHNQQLNYMNEADYERIKTLEEAGQTEQALMENLTLLHQHFADTAQEKLGYVEQAWRGVKGAISDTWDALKDIGRDSTPEQKLQAIADKRKRSDSGGITSSWENPNNVYTAQDDADAMALQMQADSAASAAFAKSQADAEQKAAISAASSLDSALHSFDKAYAKKQELDQTKAKFINLYKGNPDSELLKGVKVSGSDDSGWSVSGGTYDQLVTDINKRYTDKSAVSHADQTNNRDIADLKAQIAAKEQQLALLDQYGLAQNKISDGDKKVLQIEQQLGLAQKDRIGKVSDAQLKEQLGYAKQLSAVEKEIDAKTRAAEAQKDYNAQVDKWNASAQTEQAALNQDLALYGTEGEARKIMATQLQYEAQARDTIAKAQRDGHPLSEQQQKDLMNEADARAKVVGSLQAQRDALAAATQLQQENEKFAANSILDEKDRAAALLAIDSKKWTDLIANAGDGTEAQKKLIEQYDQWYADQQNKPVIDQWKKTVSQLDSDFHDGFLQMLTNGKASWSSFTKALENTFKTTVADALYQDLAKPFVVKVIAQLAGIVSGQGVQDALSGTSSSGSGSISSLLSNPYGTYNNLSNGYNTVMGWIQGYGGASTALGSSAIAGATTSALSAGGATLGGLGAGIGADVASSSAGYAASLGSNAYSFAMPAATDGLGLGGTLGSSAGLMYGGAGLLGGLAGGALFGNKGYSSLGGSLGAMGGLALGASSALAGTAIGAELGSFAGPIGAVAGMVIGAALGSLIGGGETRYGSVYTSDGTTDTKISAPSGGDIASDQVTQQINSTYQTIQSMATQLGGSIDGLGTYTAGYEISPKKGNSFVVAGFQDDPNQNGAGHQDLGGVKDPTTVLNDFSLQLQRSIIKSLQDANLDKPYADYLKQFDTSTLSSDQVTQIESVLNELKSLFDSIQKMGADFDNLKKVSTDAQLSVINLSGGIDQFNTNASYFYQNFVPASQQAADQAKAVTDQLAALGMVGVTTNEQFRQAVEGIDLTTTAGQQLYVQMLALAPAFNTMTQAAQQAAQAELQTMQQSRQTANQALQTALGAVQTAYDNQVQAIQSNIDSIKQFITSLTNLKQSLALGDLSTLSPQDKYLQEKQLFEQTSAAAASGDATAQGNLPQVAQDFLNASRAYNASSQAYVDDYNEVQSSLDQNIAAGQQQLSVAEQQLNATNQMVQGILSINQTTMSLSEALLQYFAARAAASMPAAPSAGSAPATINADDPTSEFINQAYQQILGRTPETDGYNYWYGQLSSGSMTQSQVLGSITTAANNQNATFVVDAYEAATGYAPDNASYTKYLGALTSGSMSESDVLAAIKASTVNGSHAGGADYIPFDGYRAELHKGEAVITSKNNQKLSRMLGASWSDFGAQNTEALIQEIRALRAEVRNLEQSQQQGVAAQLEQGAKQHTQSQATQNKALKIAKSGSATARIPGAKQR